MQAFCYSVQFSSQVEDTICKSNIPDKKTAMLKLLKQRNVIMQDFPEKKQNK